MISISIDVTKIDKTRLFPGKKGTYLDAVLIETPNSEYGDYMIVESISKEEREAGNKGTILGNGKIIVKKVYDEPAPQPKDFPEIPTSKPEDNNPDDLPF
jgi:hypothetical protein